MSRVAYAVSMEGRDVVAIAHVAHEACRVFQARFGGHVAPPWDLASAEVQLEAEHRVREVAEGKAKAPIDLHARWVDRMVKSGWRHGLSRSLEELRHPLLVGFSELSRREQAQYVLFFSIVAQMLIEVPGLRASLGTRS